MKRTTLLIVALSATVSAQSAVVSPDPAYERSEGQSFATSFGAFAAARYQFADGNLRNSAVAIKSLGVRHDHRNYNRESGMGRVWSDASIEMSECNQPILSVSFDVNALTTPTRVFSGAASWPIRLAPPSTLPSAWEIIFPFTTTWSYSGGKDVLADLRFAGGVLSNSATWSGSKAVPYYLDSFGVGAFAVAPSISIGFGNGGCVDSGATSTAGATVQLASMSYGPAVSNPSLRNKLFLQATGSNFGPSTPAILALAFKADMNGLPFPGVTCNRVHLDIRRSWFLNPVTTNASGSIAPYHFGLPSGLTAYNPLLAGLPVVVQGVWTDTKNGAMKLSAASRIGLVALPFANSADVKMTTVYDFDPSKTVASFGGNGASASIPILRYGR